MFDAKKTAEELVKLGSSRGDGWLEIDGLVIYMGPLAKAKSLRAALLVPVAAALSQAYAEGVAGAAKAASGVSSVGYDGMCYYDLSSNPSPLKRKERTMADDQWTECKRLLPPNGKKVLTKIDDAKGCRNEQVLIREGNLWFFDDHSMYVYYTPTHWREESPHA